MALPALPELTENFSMFDDWEDRYRYLLDLGKQLEPMPDELKTEENRVHGCVSQVWFVVQKIPSPSHAVHGALPLPVGEGDPSASEGSGEGSCRLHFLADSDGLITRGLIAILLSAYQDKTPQEIAAVDIEDAFHQIGLNQHLTPNRRNGFFAMVERVRSQGRA